MRLTAPCICWTLLALASLPRTSTDAGDGASLLDLEFQPCVATLTPQGQCRQGHDAATCPYLLRLPPLTVHLPRQLRDLEEILTDLQKLKDSVDELRKMCTDCTVSHNERVCEGHREGGGTELTNGEDERTRMNERQSERLVENDRGFRIQCGTDREKTTERDAVSDSEKRKAKEEAERKKWEVGRKIDVELVVPNEREESVKPVVENDRKTPKEVTKPRKTKVTAAGGNERAGDSIREKHVDKNKETNRREETGGKGNSKGDEGETLDQGKERGIITNVKNQEESDHHVWRDETQETQQKPKTEEDRVRDQTKMSEDDERHTNKQREPHGEERKKEVERGIKVERNNEKPKQPETIGRAETERSIKEGELEADRGTGKEIKTEGEKAVQSVQSDSDGELASSKAIEETDFVSISPTPRSTISLAQRPDSVDLDGAEAITSSLPSTPVSSSTSHFITDINQGATVAARGGPDLSANDLGTAEDPSRYADTAFRAGGPTTTVATRRPMGGPRGDRTSTTTRSTTTTSAAPSRGGVRSTTKPTSTATATSTTTASSTRTATSSTKSHNLYPTVFTGRGDGSRVQTKKNISSNAPTGMKPSAGQEPKPGGKHKAGIKPEADHTQKHSKYDHKSDKAPLPDKKTKQDQKLKPSQQKPTGDQKSKLGKDNKRVQSPTSDQRPDTLPDGKNVKKTKPTQDRDGGPNLPEVPNKQTNKQNNQQPSEPSDPSPTVHEKPKNVNTNSSHKQPGTVQNPRVTPNSKPAKKPVYPKTNKPPVKKQKPDKKLKNEEKTKPDQKPKSNPYFPTGLQPGSKSMMITSTASPRDKPVTELMESPAQSPAAHPKSLQEPTSGEKPEPDDSTTVNQNSTPQNKPVDPQTSTTKHKQKPEDEPKSKKEPKVTQTPASNQDPDTESNQKINPTPSTDQKPVTKPMITVDLGPSSEPKSVQEPKPGRESEKPEEKLDYPKTSETDQMRENDKKSKPDQRAKSNPFNPTQLPGSELNLMVTSTPSPKQNPVTDAMKTPHLSPPPEPKTAQEPTPGQSIKHDQIPKFNPNSKSEKKPDHPSASGKSEQKQKPKEKTKSDDQTSESNQYPIQESGSENRAVFTSTSKPRQNLVTESMKTSDLTPSPESENKSLKPPAGHGPKPDKIPKVNQNAKPEKKPGYPKTSKQNPDKKLKSEEKTKPDQRSNSGQYLTPAQKPGSENNQTTASTLRPRQKPETGSMETAKQSPSSEAKSPQEPAQGQKPKADGTPNPDQNVRPEKPVHPKPKELPKKGEEPKLGETSNSNRSVIHVQESGSESGEKTTSTSSPRYEPVTEIRKSPNQSPSTEAKSPQEPAQGQKPKSDETPSPDQNVRPENKPVHPPETSRSKKPKETSKKGEKPKLGETSNSNRSVIHVQESGSESGQKPRSTSSPRYEPVTEIWKSPDQSPSTEAKSPQESAQGQKPKAGETPNLDQNVRPKNKPVHPPETSGSKKPKETSKKGEKPKLGETSNSNRSVIHVQESGSESGQKTTSTSSPRYELVTAIRKSPDQSPSTEAKSPQEPAQGQKPKAGETPNPDQNLTPENKPVHPPETSGSKKPKETSKKGEEPKLGETSDSNRSVIHVQESGSESGQKTTPTSSPRYEPVTEIRKSPDQSPSTEATPGQKPRPVGKPPVQKEPPVRKPYPIGKPPIRKPRPIGKPPVQKPKLTPKVPQVNQKPKPNQKHPNFMTDPKTKPNVKPTQDQKPNPDRKSVPDQIPNAESNKTSKRWPSPRTPIRPKFKPGLPPALRPKPAAQPKPSPKTSTQSDPPKTSRTTTESVQIARTDMPPPSAAVKQIAGVTHPPRDTDSGASTMKTNSLDPKTSNSIESGPFPRPRTPLGGFTVSPDSRTMSDLKPQTAARPPSIPMTTRPNKILRRILTTVFPSTGPGSTKPDLASNGKSGGGPALSQTMTTAPTTTTTAAAATHTFSTAARAKVRSTTPGPAGPGALAVEASTPSTRELRVKINQVAAFPNNGPTGGQTETRPKGHGEDKDGINRPPPTRTPSKVARIPRDCSDHLLRGRTKNGVYLVTPDLHSRSFPVLCDMQLRGGGWTLLQRRLDGSVSFNRTWAEYRSGFGELDGGEFWLGNHLIHLLTRERAMTLRVELEDFDGLMEFAEYEHFGVASERMRFRLSVGGYSGTAGDALRFSAMYDHNNREFTTPDRDHDRYPSGNCGAYYSSGWWFDACMAANLNGRYYVGKYKGVRDGIFWGTWHNISMEYYPTNDRQSFKTVRMMIRPKDFRP